jgi:hypothetical protein
MAASYDAISIPDVPNVQLERRETRRAPLVFAVTLLAAGAFVGAAVVRSSAPAAPSLRASASDGVDDTPEANFIQGEVAGPCTAYDVATMTDPDVATKWTCGDMTSSDGTYTFKLTDTYGLYYNNKDSVANLTLALPGGELYMDMHGKFDKEVGIDDYTSAFGTGYGSLSGGSGDYEGAQGAVSLTVYWDDGVESVNGDDASFTVQYVWAFSIMYEFVR